jgi:hypothetical protein
MWIHYYNNKTTTILLFLVYDNSNNIIKEILENISGLNSKKIKN